MTNISVEFFAIARERAKTEQIRVQAGTVGELFSVLSHVLPEFAESCLVEGQLRAEFLLCINAKHFTRDPKLQLNDGDIVLVVSADVGG